MKRNEKKQDEADFKELMRLKSLYGVEYHKVMNARHGRLWVIHWWKRSKVLGDLFKKFDKYWKDYAKKRGLDSNLFAVYV